MRNGQNVSIHFNACSYSENFKRPAITIQKNHQQIRLLIKTAQTVTQKLKMTFKCAETAIIALQKIKWLISRTAFKLTQEKLIVWDATFQWFTVEISVSMKVQNGEFLETFSQHWSIRNLLTSIYAPDAGKLNFSRHWN